MIRLWITIVLVAWWATVASAQAVTVVHKWNEIHPVSRIQVQ